MITAIIKKMIDVNLNLRFIKILLAGIFSFLSNIAEKLNIRISDRRVLVPFIDIQEKGLKT
jgi:hypothetical protein